MSQYQLSEIHGALVALDNDLRKHMPESWLKGGLKPTEDGYAEFAQRLSRYQQVIARNLEQLSRVEAALGEREANIRGVPRDMRYRELQSIRDLQRRVDEIKAKAQELLALLWDWAYDTQRPRVTDIMKDGHELLKSASEGLEKMQHTAALQQVQRGGPVIDQAKAESLRGDLSGLVIVAYLVVYAVEGVKRKLRGAKA